MSLRLINDAKTVLAKAWSIRLALLGAAFSAAEVFLPFFTGLIPPKVMAGLAVVTSVGAAVARLVSQPKMKAASHD